jgi:hypothetical protein
MKREKEKKKKEKEKEKGTGKRISFGLTCRVIST